MDLKANGCDIHGNMDKRHQVPGDREARMKENGSSVGHSRGIEDEIQFMLCDVYAGPPAPT